MFSFTLEMHCYTSADRISVFLGAPDKNFGKGDAQAGVFLGEEPTGEDEERRPFLWGLRHAALCVCPKLEKLGTVRKELF